MKDLINKLTNLEATAPKAPAGKKMLTEDTTAPVMPKKSSLKDVFNELSESIAPGTKPLAIMDPAKKQAGMGVLSSPNPGVQNILKNLDPKDVQVVMTQQQPGQAQQQQAPAAGQPNPNQLQAGQQQVQEKWGEETKVSPSEKGKYAGKTKAELTSAYNKLKASGPHKKGSPEFGKMRELAFAIRAKSGWGKVQEESDAEKTAKDTKKAFPNVKHLTKSGNPDWKKHGFKDMPVKEEHDYSDYEERNMLDDLYDMDLPKPGDSVTIDGRHGIVKSEVNQDTYGGPAEFEVKYDDGTVRLHSVDTILNGDSSYDEDFIDEGAKVDRMVKHIEKSERKLGKSKEKASDIAWATANKRGYLDNKNKKKTNEGYYSVRSNQLKQELENNGWERIPGRELPGHAKYGYRKNGVGSFYKVIDEPYDSFDAVFVKPRRVNALISLDKLLQLIKGSSVSEADIPSTQGVDTRGAGLGAGRSMTTLEGKKPDFLDLDKDGNKKESMKKAAADKKKKKVDESMNHRISAARLEGKSHGLRGHAHCGKSYDDLEEMKAYHEGYKEGLDECYGQGVYETAPAATVPGMATQALDELSSDTVQSYIGKARPDSYAAGGNPDIKKRFNRIDGVNTAYSKLQGGANVPAMEDEFDEGNAFTAGLARAKKGEKFSVGGKTFTDRTSYDAKIDEYAFEAWDRELQNLLTESETVSEGLSVSVSKGQQNAPDSVTITAQDAEADQLLQLVKHAGLGLFGDDAGHEEHPSSAMSIQPSQGEPNEVGSGGAEIDVVDDSDGMLALMKKLGGVESSGDEDEEEHTCNECGMMEAGCQCDKEQVEEVESEDQMEYEVAEDNAPDSGAEDSVADEDAEAKEDGDLAGADSDDEEEMNEGFSFESIYRKLDAIAEGSGDKPKHPEHDKKDEKDYDDAEEEDEESEELDEGKWNYPKHMTKNVTTSDMDTTNAARNREERKAFRKKEKAKAHAALMKGEPKKEKDEELNEWANQVGKGPGKGTDASFEQDIEFMTKVIAGGLNKPKSTGQTTVPVIAGQDDRMHDNPNDWATLAGIKK